MDKFISLFDYLHKPAGNELGLQVYKKAMEENEPVSYRNVTTARYSGKVKLYRESFLNKYFKPTTPQPPPVSQKQEDELPF
jgi:hypothetical protein